MRYLSVCSGIEAATVAWHPLGWEPAAFSEIEPFPRAVLAHHYPNVPCHGDFTTIGADDYGAIDLLVGGTPCQSFSIAGLRGGLDDDRGNLALEFLRLADRKRPRWLVWENVPGVLSIDGGRAFGSILGGMGELGYGFAYRVLDAQHFGVPQRRRRVFVVGYLGDWRRAAAVLFERHSLSGHPAPRREAREAVAALTANGVGTCGADDNQGQAGHLIAADVTATLPAGGNETGGNRYPGTSAETCSEAGPQGKGWQEDCAYTLEARNKVQAVAFDMRGREDGAQMEGPHDTANLRAASGGSSRSYIATSAVRRLTPVECERLQGFPDQYTNVPYRGKPAADGPRYKALGNSMAVPVMAWLGQRIAAVDAIKQKARAA
ncbi:DNA cytosine methyltransferase [Novosphingobium sp. HII-3]|uniref:DNA cytosine methyltransferase n=1 Tax=Novosphingobium sp. HII-3 TaxID=2075565 RepID=UPI000CDB2794|nr:DNA cytosine methyltransferase [Novosphingobium sp. HII-3]